MHLSVLRVLGLVVFATMALAAPLAPLYPTYTTLTNLDRRMDQHECPANKLHYPNFSSWERGMNQFCDNHANENVHWDKPVTMTLTINGKDGKPIEWMYKISVDNGTPPGAGGQLQWSYFPGAKLCKDKFMGLTKDKGGGVGKVYCNWNDSKQNLHDQVMWGGQYGEVINPEYWAKVVWETRAKNGQAGL